MFRVMREVFENVLELVFIDYWPVSMVVIAAVIAAGFILL